MHVYFEDWSMPIVLERLDQRGLEHGGRVIKVFAAAEDPRRALGRASLVTPEVSGAVFGEDEVYDYNGRGVYPGAELEAVLAAYDFTNGGGHLLRALFRFSNLHGFCQAAMNKRAGDEWLIDHPFGDVDGLHEAARDPGREKNIHLDIFFPESLDKLRSVVDYDDSSQIVGIREGINWRGSS